MYTTSFEAYNEAFGLNLMAQNQKLLNDALENLSAFCNSTKDQ